MNCYRTLFLLLQKFLWLFQIFLIKCLFSFGHILFKESVHLNAFFSGINILSETEKAMEGVLDTLYFMDVSSPAFIVFRVNGSSVFGEKTKIGQTGGKETTEAVRSLRVFKEHSLGFPACPQPSFPSPHCLRNRKWTVSACNGITKPHVSNFS